MNPRKTFDEEAIKELADNIDKQGLIQPITIRPTAYEDQIDEASGEVFSAPTDYEIVCGERRYRAFCLLKAKEDNLNIERVAAHRKKYDRFQSIPSMIREMSDDEAFEAMITENLQRQDVDPMEEAFAFSQLIKNGKTAEEVALKFGKSIRFVQDRCKLNSLIPELMLAVKEDKMSIAAAMIICKLDEEGQKKYHSQYSNNYQGFTKSNAQIFVDNLFMNLNKSLWYQSDNQADEDFAGGCGTQCSQCPLNTANHGCLFYEMKSEDTGRCTDRAKFRAKTIAYMIHAVESQSERLVKKGEPLDYGKTVIAIKTESYENDASIEFKKQITELIHERGYEVVAPDKVFKSKCWYESTDERTLDMIKTGEVYRVISLFNYDKPTVEEQFWYVKRNSAGENESGLPVNVSTLLDKYKAERTSLPSQFVIDCAKAMGEHNVLSDVPLTDVERKLFMLLVLQSNYKLRSQLKLGQISYRDEDYKYIAEHPDIFNLCARAWLQGKVAIGNNPELRQAEPILDELGALWCPEEYRKAKDKVQAKFDKSVAKITKQLADLGYDLEGNKLPEKPADTTPTIAQIKEQYEAMKKQRSGAIIIFRLGDEYECIEQDANVIAISLGLKLQNKGNTPFVKFPKAELDAYIRELVKVGHRVAICEQLDAPNK
jgi:ParB-like chromosome segregation protein Spo0J